MIKSLKYYQTIKKLYTKPKKELVYPHLQILKPNIMHEIDVLYLPNDHGFKYLLTIIDLHNSLCDARGLKNLDITSILHSLDDIYDNSMHLSYPNCIQADNGFHNNQFKNWCNNNDINLKITEAYQHRQNAHVERLNQSIGKIIWLYQVNTELETGKPFTRWHNIYRDVIQEINAIHLKGLNKSNERKEKEQKDEPILNKQNNKIIDIGTKVRKALDKPESLQGVKYKNDKFRTVDHRWSTKQYEVVQSYLMANNPPMYQIKDINTNRVLKSMYTYERLQVV